MTPSPNLLKFLQMDDLDSLRQQVQQHAITSKHNRLKRLAQFHLLVLICMMGSNLWATVAIWAVAIGTEIAATLNVKGNTEAAHLSVGQVARGLCYHLMLSVCYASPALILSFEPASALYIAGLISIMGMLTSVSLGFSSTPTLYFLAAIVVYPVAAITALNGILSPPSPSTPTQMLIPAGFLLVHLTLLATMFTKYRGIFDDLAATRSESMRRLRRLEHVNNHDQLTDLQNRRAFTEKLAAVLKDVPSGRSAALMIIDLDGFKPINDLYGHEAGDEVLRSVSARLLSLVPGGAEVFRLGGDEFAVLVTDGRIGTLKSLGRRLAEKLSEAITFGQRELHVGASVGIAIAEPKGITARQLTTNADAAMYLAKSRDDQSAVLFNELNRDGELTEADRVRFDRALKGGAIRPHYQPRFRASDGLYVGAEALARLSDRSGKILPAAEFVDDLMKLGMAEDLTHLMLRSTLEDISAWLDTGFDPGRVSVNIAEVTLSSESGRRDLDWILSQYPGLENFLAFEITEDIYVSRARNAICASLEHFRTKGVTIVLDDFGVGPGAYPFLQDMTPDELKIDESLVANIGNSDRAETALGGFISIARSLGAKITAEGVETEEQRLALAAIGCDFVQGHHFEHAVPANDLPDTASLVGPLRSAS